MQRNVNGSIYHVCTLILIRPTWLIGSYDECVGDRIGNKTQDEVENQGTAEEEAMKEEIKAHRIENMGDEYQVYLRKKVRRVETLTLPYSYLVRMQKKPILLAEIERYDLVEMALYPSLRFSPYSYHDKELYAVDYNGTIRRTRLKKPVQTNCSGDLKPVSICGFLADTNIHGPLLHLNGDEVRMYGVWRQNLLDESEWVVLSLFRKFINANLEKFNKDIYLYSSVGYLTYKIDGHICTVVQIQPGWFVSSITYCGLSELHCDLPEKDMANWTVTVYEKTHSMKIEVPVTRMYSNYEYDRFTGEDDVMLIRTRPVENSDKEFITANFATCEAHLVLEQETESPCRNEYIACYLIDWHKNGTTLEQRMDLVIPYSCRFGKKSAWKNESKRFCSIISKTMNKHGIILCNRYDNPDFDFYAMQVSVVEGEYSVFAKMIPHKENINDTLSWDVKYKFPHVANLWFEEKIDCTVAMVATLHFIGSKLDCKLHNNTVDWSQYTIRMYDTKVDVSQVYFSSNVDPINGNRLVLIEINRKIGFTLGHPALIPDYPCRYLLSITLPGDAPVFGVHEEEFDKDRCNVTDIMSERDLYFCAVYEGERFEMGPLFYRTNLNYFLIGIISSTSSENLIGTNSLKAERWFLLITFKSWIDDIVQNRYAGPVEGRTTMLPAPELPIDKLSLNDTIIGGLNLGHEIDWEPYRVRITKLANKQTCQGYLLAVNWVVTTSNCVLWDDGTMGLHLTSAQIETKTDDVSLVAKLVPGKLSGVDLPKNDNETYLFLELLWPVLNDSTVQPARIAPYVKDQQLNYTRCSVTGVFPKILANKIGYGIPYDSLRQISVSMIDTDTCQEFYPEASKIPWNAAYCSNTARTGVEPYFGDVGSRLACDGFLNALRMHRWNRPGKKDPKEPNVTVPTGWLRLNAFQTELETIIRQDPSQYRNVDYGHSARWDQWKFMGSLEYKGHHICSVALVAPNVAMLNGRGCGGQNLNKSKDDLRVVFGKYDLKLSDPAQREYKIKQIKNINNGIVLLQLATNVEGVPSIDRSNAVLDEDAKKKCRVAGWPSERVTRWYDSQQFEETNPLRENAYFSNGTGGNSCLADSSAVLLCKGRLSGLVDFDNCAKDYPRLVVIGNISNEIDEFVHQVAYEDESTFPGLYRFLACITIKNIYKCIGTLVHARWILTSHECLVDQNHEDIRVVMGTSDLTRKYEGEFFNIIKFTLPPHNKTDIGMILLDSSPSLRSGKYRTIDLLQVAAKRNCKVFVNAFNETVGWPAHVPGKHIRPIQRGGVLIESSSACENFNDHEMTDEHLCTSTKHAGDRMSFLKYSGGPLMCSDSSRKYRLQIGVNAWGLGEMEDEKSAVVFFIFDKYLDWITTQIKLTPRDPYDTPDEADIIEHYEERFIYDRSANTIRCVYNVLCFSVFLLVYNV